MRGGSQNGDELWEDYRRFERILHLNGYYVEEHAFLLQIDPKTKRAVKMWLVDAGQIYSPELIREKLSETPHSNHWDIVNRRVQEGKKKALEKRD